MTAPVPAAPSVPSPQPMTRKRLETLLGRQLPGVKLAPVRKRIMMWADAYAAKLAEDIARPDDRWEPK